MGYDIAVAKEFFSPRCREVIVEYLVIDLHCLEVEEVVPGVTHHQHVQVLQDIALQEGLVNLIVLNAETVEEELHQSKSEES
jgi:precorrin-2 methylase